MLVKIKTRILIFPGTDFHFPSTSVPPGTFLGSAWIRRRRYDGVDVMRQACLSIVYITAN